MKEKTILYLLMLMISFWGCKKEEIEPDTMPPDINITNPVEYSLVRDAVMIKTIVADHEGVDYVEFYIDGNLVSTLTTEPYEILWDTKEYTDGAHTLFCKAVDSSGNVSLSETVLITVNNLLLTAHFINDWLCEDCGVGILFISNMEGTVLAEATWTGNETIKIPIPDSLTEIPDKITVSTVKRKKLSDRAYIYTNFNIDIGSTWTWKGIPDFDHTPNIVDFKFNNIPTDHDGALLSSKRSRYTFQNGNLPTYLNISTFEPPEDIFIRLNTFDSNPKYKWVHNVEAGYYEVDLSNIEETTSKTINFQNGLSGYTRKSVIGYPIQGNRYAGSYQLDYSLYDFENINTSIDVFYPPSYFSDYRTSLYCYDTPTFESSYWYQLFYGNLPDTFEKVDADFEYINISHNNFKITTTTYNFDQLVSYWLTSDITAIWQLDAPANYTEYTLPDLPIHMSTLFPNIQNENFELYDAGLIDHSELSSYDDIIDIVYKSESHLYDEVHDMKARYKRNPTLKFLKEFDEKARFDIEQYSLLRELK